MSRHEFSKPTCTVDECEKPTVGRGLCRRHYNRWYKHGSPLAGGTSKGALTKWISENAKYEGTGCLTWPFHRSGDGVAKCTYNGRKMNAARAMCIEAHGQPPSPQHDAAHSCGKAHEACVNPTHLRWATKKQNQADRLMHGTALRGERNPAAKLTNDEVKLIIGLEGKATHKQIAHVFNISRQHVGAILARSRWSAP